MAVTLTRTNRALNKRTRKVATEYGTAMRAVTKTRTRQIALEAKARVDQEIPPDDGIAPAAPVGLTVSAQRRGAFADWTMPAALDYVARAVVRVKQQANGALVGTYTTTATNYRVQDLTPGIVYTVEVQYVDRFGRVGPWTAAVAVTPARSVADEVDLAGLAQLGLLNGLLPNANLGTITDATKLAAGLVSSRELSDLAVSANKLADYAVGPGKVATDAVTTRAIAANAVVANAIAAGAVTATSMATQNAAAINLWVQDAAIQSAKIAKIVADKIDTGILSAQVSISSTGKISAAGASMDSGGLSLTEVASQNSPPNVGPGSKITNAGVNKWAGIQPFNAAPLVARRGWGLWADGVAGGTLDGAIRLIATNGSQDPALLTTSYIYMESSSTAGSFGSVNIGRDLSVERALSVGTDLAVARNLNIVGLVTGQTEFSGHVIMDSGLEVSGGSGFTATTGTITAGGSSRFQFQLEPPNVNIVSGSYQDFYHNWNSIPSEIHAKYSPAGTGQWFEVPGGPVTANAVSVYSASSYIRVRNSSADTISVKVRLNK